LVNQFYDISSPSKKITTTEKTMTMLESDFTKILLNINPGVIPFLTATTINEGKKIKTLRPYMAPVNHNILNTEKAINIAHTILGNFCHGDESKNSQMETMGMDSCMINGYHDKESESDATYHFIPDWKIMFNLFILFTSQ
jgi:hypothetical protein